MWSLIGNLPFIGKYKRQLGTVLTLGGLIATQTGNPELGQQLQGIGVSVLGVGVAHAEIKEKREKKRNGQQTP